MSRSLKEEIRQQKPFKSLYQEAELNVVRTANTLTDSFERMLRPHGITATQYNVLRILRGAEPNGLCRNDVRDRLLTRMPDATRLLDRMEAAGLVKRDRDSEDRRMVTTRITQKGRKLVDSLDDAAESEHRQTLGHMTNEQLRELIRLLTLIRNPG